LQYKNGERYEGQWKANLANGQGKLTYADGDQYVGDWKDGKKSGYGELIYTNGDKFRFVVTLSRKLVTNFPLVGTGSRIKRREWVD
jgi:hypothetical protein